jgi:glycosyltransferase involved in cell wall biosynthesis
LAGRVATGWKSLYAYVGFLADAREASENDGRFSGPVGRARRVLLTVRFLARKRMQKARNTRRLAVARAYRSARGEDDEPLVSVVIPTHNRCALLTGRAIPSALNQTYPNVELVVVADRCDDGTERKVEALGSERIKVFRLPRVAGRPEVGHAAWLQAGVDGSNLAIRMSSGEWIVHLDDDDELAPDAVETMLKYALENDLEMVYPKVLLSDGRGAGRELGSFPPGLGGITHSGVMFGSHLKFMPYDRDGYRWLEPGDWCLWRRMVESGVRVGFVDRVLGTIYPAGPAEY